MTGEKERERERERERGGEREGRYRDEFTAVKKTTGMQ